MKTEWIERFFGKQCTPEEAKKIAAYLKANPLLLEKYLSLYEWNSVATGNNMPEEFWSEIWHNIEKENKAKIISLKLKRVAAAACFILMIGAIYYYLIPEKQISKPVTHVNVLPKIQHQTILNTAKKIKTVVLEDSSVVQLSPNSSIQYDVPFPYNKREIFLEGEAKFRVIKNKTKTFTVYAGALATTALGTVFSIKSGDKNNVTVKLFQGKVIIHSTEKNLKGWKDDVYLLPGEQMKFDAEKMLLAVEKMNNSNIKTVVKIKKPGTDSLTNQLIFNNTLLPEVMNRLSVYYNIKIQYDSLLIDSMNFSGIVLRSDSLPIILKAISQMNDLEIIKSDSGFIISKHQQ